MNHKLSLSGFCVKKSFNIVLNSLQIKNSLAYEAVEGCWGTGSFSQCSVLVLWVVSNFSHAPFVRKGDWVIDVLKLDFEQYEAGVPAFKDIKLKKLVARRECVPGLLDRVEGGVTLLYEELVLRLRDLTFSLDPSTTFFGREFFRMEEAYLTVMHSLAQTTFPRFFADEVVLDDVEGDRFGRDQVWGEIENAKFAFDFGRVRHIECPCK